MSDQSPLRGADHTTMREVNRSLVLDLIKAGGRPSRASIARATTLAKPTVSVIVDELIADGLVREIGIGVTAGGRPPILLEYNARSQLVAGIHLGARQTTIAIADGAGAELARRQLATPVGPAAETLALIAGHVRDAVDEVEPASPDRDRVPVVVGVVLPGLTDFHTGVCLLAPNLGWTDVPVGAVLADALQSPVYVHNAGQAAAVAENLEGAGGRVGNLALLYAGTGLSAGVLSDGKVFHGVGGTAGEIGHCSLPGLTQRCGCGRIGCLETVASARGLVRTVERLLAGGRASVLRGRTDLDGRDVAAAAADGDEVAIEAVAELGEYLGLAASWLINAYNPAVVVLGGGLSELGEPLLEPLRKAAAERALGPALRGVEIRRSQLGADAELRGAVLLALQHSETYYRVVFRA